MKKKILAVTLSCSLLLSATAPALAIRAPGTGEYGPISVSGTTQRSYVTTGSVSFEQLNNLIEKNNLTIRMLREQLASAKAMDWKETYDELYDAMDEIRDGKDELEDTQDELKDAKKELNRSIDVIKTQRANLETQIAAATKASEDAFSAIAGVLANAESSEADILAALQTSKAADSTLSALKTALESCPTEKSLEQQISTLDTNLETIEDNLDTLDESLDKLKDQVEEVEKQEAAYNRTMVDTERQIENTIDQIAAGAKNLYLTILSTQNQLTAMNDTAASTARTIEEMTLRAQLGQVSRLTVAQVQNGYDQLISSFPALETAIDTMKASLQSLLGEMPTGELLLEGTPSVPEGAIAAIDYKADLAIAEENSFALYTARRTVEDAKRDMDDALKDEGPNSYQYKMAQHAYEAALLTQDSAIDSFALSFRQLYAALAPAQATLTSAEAALAYQEESFAVTQLKYDLGKISKNALLSEEDVLTSARRAVETAQLDLFSAWNSYRQGVDYGLVTAAS